MHRPDFRINTYPPYVLKQVEANAKTAQKEGRDVIRFGMGIPDIPTPEPIVEVVRDALLDPKNLQYPEANGHPELLGAIDRYCQRNHGFTPDADKKFVIPGVKPGIGHFFYGALFPDTPVLAPTPYYPIHDMGPKLAGADVITCDVRPGENHVAAIIHAYEAAVRKPRFLLISFPHNPTTETVKLEQLEELVDYCADPERDIYILSDEAYIWTQFDRKRAPSILDVEKARKRCLAFFSFSKSLSMSGFRVAFAVGCTSMTQALASTDSYLLYGVPSFIQMGAAYGLDNIEKLAPPICDVYKARSAVFSEAFTAAGWPVGSSSATMFRYEKISPPFDHLDSFAFTKMLLDEADLGVAPGKGFGSEGEGSVRFSLSQTETMIYEAAQRYKSLARSQG